MMNTMVVVIPVLAVLLSGCAAMRSACYIAALAAYDTPFYRSNVVVSGVGSVVLGVGRIFGL